MIFNYTRRKRLSNKEEKKFYDWDKFKDHYGFELRDADPTLNSFEYNKQFIEESIKELCKTTHIANLFDNSLVFNRFKLQIEDLEEVVQDLPFQLFFPLFERYFPEIKNRFLKEFIDNGINHTYEEVKNHIVNYSDMRYIIDPMNIAIKKTLAYINDKFKSNKIDELNRRIAKVSSKTWFGDEHDGEYELSLADYFIAYEKCLNEIHANKMNFWSIMSQGLISSLIMYFWYVTCDYFYNSKDKKISYIRTDVEMFYMRNLHNNTANYTYFKKLVDEKHKVEVNDLESWFNYYSSFTDFANAYLGNDKTKYFELVKKLSEWKSKYKTMLDVPTSESLGLFAEIDQYILIMDEQIKSRKENSLGFDPLERLIECIVDPIYNSIEECRPKIYLDLATPKSEYDSNKEKNNGK